MDGYEVGEKGVERWIAYGEDLIIIALVLVAVVSESSSATEI